MNKRSLLAIVASAVLLTVLAPRLMAQAPTGRVELPAAEPWRRAPGQEVVPALVERRSLSPDDPAESLLSFELRMGGPRTGCAPWRFGTWGLPDGRVIFQIDERTDRKVLLSQDIGGDHLDLIVGDAICNYRVRIERNR